MLQHLLATNYKQNNSMELQESVLLVFIVDFMPDTAAALIIVCTMELGRYYLQHNQLFVG